MCNLTFYLVNYYNMIKMFSRRFPHKLRTLKHGHSHPDIVLSCEIGIQIILFFLKSDPINN